MNRGLKMKTLTIKLAAPLQSYGNEATFNYRTSYHYPSKSAILGMIAAAMGYRRDDDQHIQQLNQLAIAVRIDQPGTILSDFHIVEYNRKKNERKLTYRDYLQDAVFLVAISGKGNQIDEINEALRHPRFQLSLGRRANVPAGPLKTMIFDDRDPIEILSNVRWQASTWYQRKLRNNHFIDIEIIADAELLPDKRNFLVKDQVGSFSQKGRYHKYRAVVSIHVKLSNDEYRTNDTRHDIMSFL